MNKSRILPIRIPLDEYDELRSLADKERRSISELVRLAIEAYAQERGYNLDLRVERGGDKERKSDN